MTIRTIADAETDLFDLACKFEQGQQLTATDRAEIANVLKQVAAGRRVWDKHAAEQPDENPTDRAHEMRGVLAYVIGREL